MNKVKRDRPTNDLPAEERGALSLRWLLVLNQNKLSDFSGDGLSVMEWNTLPKRQEFPLFHHRGHDLAAPLPLCPGSRIHTALPSLPTQPTMRVSGGDRSAISVEGLSLPPFPNRLQIFRCEAFLR